MDIKVRDLKQTDTIKNADKLMVLVDDDLNLVKNISKEEFLTNVISTSENNALVQADDGNLYVNTSKIAESVAALDNKFTSEIGDLNSLTTEAKNNLVSAINEAAQSGDSGISSGTSLPLFTSIIMDRILNFEDSKGYALQGTYVYKNSAPEIYGYPDFYAKCMEEKTASEEVELTVGESTITTYKNANGHVFYDISDKDIIDNLFQTNGIAWYYGIDEENERIFLPRGNVSYSCEQDSVPVIGTGKSLGWTDGTYNLGLCGRYDGSNNLAYLNTDAYNTNVGTQVSGSANGTRYVSAGIVQDPATSGVIAQTSSLSAFDSIKYLYIIVGNTEQIQTITEVTEVTTSENDTIPLFTGQYFDFKPNNVSWLKAGGQANSGGIYTSAYNTLVSCLAEANNIYDLKVIEESEMIAGVDYSEYWKVNQDEMYFITPTALSYKALNGGVKGNGTTMGLTNGTTNSGLSSSSTGDLYASPNYYDVNIGTNPGSFPSTKSSNFGVTSDASKSGIIAEESTAQLYFKVANAVQNLELLDAGEVLESLADKVDINSSVIDGQWVAKESEILCSASAKGSYTIDLSSYLPDDNNCYEVMVCGKIYNSSSTYSLAHIESPLMAQKIVAAAGGNSRVSVIDTIVAIDLNRSFILNFNNVINSWEESPLKAVAYRRIGTNI